VACPRGGGEDATEAPAPASTEPGTTSDGAATTDGGGAFPADAHPAAGKAVFASAGCGSCHTLAAAGSTGPVGPNLDQLGPDFETVVNQVTTGGNGMPAFSGQLSEQEIRNVAAFIVQSTSAGSPTQETTTEETLTDDRAATTDDDGGGEDDEDRSGSNSGTG
jgi:mono/diheme cytochrome c family protein